VLITGCSSGIGLCVAGGLKSRGYRVIATARKQADVRRLTDDGFESLELDLSDPASIASALDEILQRTGNRLYALFNNGGFGQPGAVEDLSMKALRAQFEVNFFGWHDLTRRVLPVMRAQGEGRIIQNSSVLGFVALKYRGAYNASKFAVEGLSDTLRLELAGSGVHVSLIEPGPIISRFRQNAYRAFKENIDAEHSPHRNAYRSLERRLANDEKEPPFTLPAKAVLERVLHALESSRPKPRYYVTVPTYGFGMLKRLLPTRLLDRLLAAASGAEVRH
jgi:NAD(P)-dependent dehydrogenase (short-subunit alcohol dehydrogenase family)